MFDLSVFIGWFVVGFVLDVGCCCDCNEDVVLVYVLVFVVVDGMGGYVYGDLVSCFVVEELE